MREISWDGRREGEVISDRYPLGLGVVAVNRPLFSVRIPIKSNVSSTTFDANSRSNDRSMIL
jgi:hypothetical protein